MAVLKYKDTNGEWKKLFDGLKISADEALNEGSTNPIQNKPVAEAINRLTAEKQDRLISGVNIRKINGQDLLDPDQLDKDIIIPPGSKTYVLYPLSFSNGNATVDELNEHSANHIDIHKEIYDSVINNETYNYIEGYTAGYAMKLDGSTYVALNKIIKNKNDNNYITFTSVILTDDNQIVTTDLTIREDGSIRSDVTTRTTYITDETIEPFLAAKQDILIDGTENTPSGDQNIKTIGGESIFGEGNIPVTASIESGKDIKNLEDTKGTYEIVGEGSILLKTLTVNGEEHSLIGDESNKTITIAGGGGGDGDYTDLLGKIALKQDKLVDQYNITEGGTINFKTINNQSLLVLDGDEETNIQISTGEGGPTEPSVIFREILAEGDALPSDAKEDDTYASYNIETIRLTSEGKALPVMDGVLPLMHSIDDYHNMIAIFETVTYEMGDLMGALGGILGASAVDNTATVDDTSASSSLTEASAPGAVGMKSAIIIEVGSDGELTVPDNSGLLGANVLLPKSIDPSLPTFNLDIFGVDESMLEGLEGDITECLAEICNELSTSPVEPDTDTYEIVYGIDGAKQDVLAQISPQWFKDNDGNQYNGWYDTEDSAAAAGTIVDTASAYYDSTVDETTGEVKGWGDWTFSGGYTPSTASADDEYATSTVDDSSSSDSLGLDKLMLISPSLYTYYNHISYGSCIGMMKGSIMDIGYPTAYVNPLHTLFNVNNMFPTVLRDVALGGTPSFDPVSMINPLAREVLGAGSGTDEKAEYYYTKAIEIAKFFMSDNGPLGGLMSGDLSGLDSISSFMGMFFSSSIVQHVQFGEDTTGMSAESYFPWALDVQYSFAGATFVRHYILDVQSLAEGTKGYTMFFDELLDTASAGGSGGSVEASAEIYIGNDNEDLNASGAVIWINPDGEPAGETPGSSIVVVDDNMTGIPTAVSGVTYIKNFPSDAINKSFTVRSYGEANTNLSHYTFHLKGASSIELPAGTIWANGLIPDALDPNCIYEIDVYGTKFVSTYYYKATYAVFPLQ